MLLPNLSPYSLVFFCALLGISALWSCQDPCYETSEPEVELLIINRCDYENVIADGIMAPIPITNTCGSRRGEVAVTLPLDESRKTYFFTKNGLKVDSITIDYTLAESFQSKRCGYVVKVPFYSIDSNVSSLKCKNYYDLSYYEHRDSIEVVVVYSVRSDQLVPNF